MALVFSRACEYALQAVLFMARNAGRRPMLLQDISRGLAIPHHFLGKVMQRLAQAGIVESHKGAKGGFNLKRPATQITLRHIVESVDGVSSLNECLLGFPNCSDDHPCPAHPQWKNAKKSILQIFENKTVDALSRSMDSKLIRRARVTKPVSRRLSTLLRS